MPSLAHLPHRQLISLSGRDTFKYLQALTTNTLSPPTSQYTCFLNAQGRVLYDAFIYRTAESECLVETDARNVDDLMAHLKRYKLRSKFEMRKISGDELAVYAYFNAASLVEAPSFPSAAATQRDGRAPGFGYRVVSSTSPLHALNLDLATSVLEYTRHRFRHAVPEGPDELSVGKALPLESNIDLMSGVEFHKGCYLGQELTVRTYHTGVVRKRVVPIQLETQDDSGDDFWIPDEPCHITMTTTSGVKPRPAGRVLASIGSLGLALMRLDQLGVRGTAAVHGKDTGLVGQRPDHWPPPGSNLLM